MAATKSQELAFYNAVLAAEATRQAAKAAAFSAYNFSQAGLATYKTALIAAEVAYLTSITTAATTNGISPSAAGTSGPIHNSWSKVDNG